MSHSKYSNFDYDLSQKILTMLKVRFKFLFYLSKVGNPGLRVCAVNGVRYAQAFMGGGRYLGFLHQPRSLPENQSIIMCNALFLLLFILCRRGFLNADIDYLA